MLPALVVAASAALQVSAATYQVAKDYSGSTFFDEWDFYGKHDDTTSGHVFYQDRANATAKKIAYVNDKGNAVVAVATDTVVWDNKRDSVRLTSQREYGPGTVWIADIVHMPFGCSVWPAFWTKGHNWPDDGEIDILEGINLQTTNQMALHTKQTCSHSTSSSLQSGRSGEPNCTTDAGCTVTETKANSYGEAFNKAGGGVYATRFGKDGIDIWFWSRADIPRSIQEATSTSPLTTQDDWGLPTGSFPSGPNCDMSTAFSEQSIVINISLCGVWAGNLDLYLPQCPAKPNSPPDVEDKCYIDQVVGDGSNYREAYFEFGYVRAYTDGTSPNNTPSGSSGAPAPGASTTNAPGTGAASALAVPAFVSMLVGVAGLFFVL